MRRLISAGTPGAGAGAFAAARSGAGAAIDEAEVRMPFRVTGTEGRFNAMIKVAGGGFTQFVFDELNKEDGNLDVWLYDLARKHGLRG